MSRQNYTFTSESVSEGHPDKVADQVSDSVVDAILEADPDGRVARFPRCLARFSPADGRRGVGWIEWNQPQQH